jgi:hypothetical protein
MNRSSHEAATMAADDGTINQASPGVALPEPQPASSTTIPRSPSLTGHFTTIEEEEARLRAEGQRPWLTIAAQLAALITVLGGMIAVAMYLSRPPSADALYQTISEQAVATDDASIANVEREIEEFLRRFPTDARAAELQKYEHRLTLDKAERRLQRDARGSGNANPQLLPAERLYVQAVDLADAAPDRAIGMLQSLADLYGPNAPDVVEHGDTDAENDSHDGGGTQGRIAIAVQLAQRKVESLQDAVGRERTAQLAALRERLDVAQRLSKVDATRAAAMYRAVIDLHQGNAWAADVVATARERLTELKQP